MGLGANLRAAAMRSLVVAAACCASVGAAPPEDAAALIRYADEIKTADNAAFQTVLADLERRSSQFSPAEQAWVHYLKAWQRTYTGDDEQGIASLKSVIVEAADPALRFRAQITLIDEEASVANYEDAYERLDELLNAQPQIADRDARLLAYAVAALLYNRAGQYELGITYAERWLAEDPTGVAACKGAYLKADALFRSGKLGIEDDVLRSGIAACAKIGEPLFASLLRAFIANIHIAQGHANEAIALLLAHDAELQRTNSAQDASEFHSVLARAYLISGDLANARHYAASTIEKAVRNPTSKPLADAYEVLSRVAQREGDYRAALEFHEQYTAADKRHIGQTSAQALAFQMVNQRVLDKKRLLVALNEKNQMLLLQQQVSEKSAESERLYILLLLLVIGFITLWTYRLKRSQERFARLARRDGLTGIVNREHFMDQSKAMLQACARSQRELCLILIDLDNFKNVNDTHGHIAGDGVLKQTVEMCQLHMRANDLFGRLGGEEFGVMLADCTLEAAHHRAEELREAVESFARAGVEVTVTASFGVATVRLSGYELRQMLIHADSALYRAKRNGRNRVEVFIAPKVAETMAKAAAGGATADPDL